MKKLSVFLLFLLASCPFISAHEDDDNDSSEPQDGDDIAPYSCDLQTSNGYYSANDLYKSQGNAYSGKDYNGNTVYFNLCGDLSSLDAATLGCDPTSSVCIQTAYNSFISAGKPYGSWEEVDDQTSDVSQAIEIVYTGGDSCYTNDGYYTDYQTTIILNCSSSNDFDIVSVTVENCQVTIQAFSMDGCPQPRTTHVFMFGPIIAFTLTCLACCGLTFCCCACIRRRRDLRRQQPQNVEMKYQPVAQRAPQPVTPQPVVPMHLAMPPHMHMQMPAQPHMPMHMQPYMMPMPMHFQPTPQYFQPQPYFQPQAPHMAPAPLVALEDVNTRDNQVTDDEKLARELQAKFDNE